MTNKEVSNYVLNSKIAIYGTRDGSEFDLLMVTDLLAYLYSNSKNIVYLALNEDEHELSIPEYLLSSCIHSYIDGESDERNLYSIAGGKHVGGDNFYRYLYVNFLSFDEYKKEFR